MVMTFRLKLPGSFSDTTLPLFKIDPILPENGGAVFLIDPTHPIAPWNPGVPSNDAVVPNIVAEQPELGSAPLSSAIGGPLTLYYKTDGNLTGSYGKIERTEKGGLHTIISQNGSVLTDLVNHTGGKYYQTIRPNGVYTPQGAAPVSSLRDYLWGTSGTDGAAYHKFFLSMWSRITRRRVSGTQRTIVAGLTLTNSYSSGFNVAVYGPQGPTESHNSIPSATLSHAEAAGNYSLLGAPSTVLGNELQQVASNSYHPGGSPSKSTTYLSAMDAGQLSEFGTTGTGAKGNHGSYIFYRSYLEDLTVSGRTFQQVSAIDSAMYNREVLSAGGRYYGDTFTDPAIIP